MCFIWFCNFFSILKTIDPNFKESIESALRVVASYEMIPLFVDWYGCQLSLFFKETLLPKIESEFNIKADDSTDMVYRGLNVLYSALKSLHDYSNLCDVLTESSYFSVILQSKVESCILPILSQSFLDHIMKLYQDISDELYSLDENFSFDVFNQTKANQFRTMNAQM